MVLGAPFLAQQTDEFVQKRFDQLEKAVEESKAPDYWPKLLKFTIAYVKEDQFKKTPYHACMLILSKRGQVPHLWTD